MVYNYNWNGDGWGIHYVSKCPHNYRRINVHGLKPAVQSERGFQMFRALYSNRGATQKTLLCECV